MSDIRLRVVEQCITMIETPAIYSGDVNYDTVTFEFDSAWTDFVKTAVFYRDKDNAYCQLLEDDTCLIPHEVLTTEGCLYISVFGRLDDVTITSQVVKYRILEGAITEDLNIPDPTPDIYEQILTSYTSMYNRTLEFEETVNTALEVMTEGKNQIDNAIASANQATDSANQATEASVNKLDKTANAVSASKLQTARKIGNADFDGTEDISLKDIGAELTESATGALISVSPSYEGTACVEGLVHNYFDADTIYGAYKQSDGSFNADMSYLNRKRRYFTEREIGKTFYYSAMLKTTEGSSGVFTRAVINGVGSNGTRITNTTAFETSRIIVTPTSVDDYVELSYGGGGTTVSWKDVMLSEVDAPYVPYSGYEVKSCGKNFVDLTKLTDVSHTDCTYTNTSNDIEIVCGSNTGNWSQLLGYLDDVSVLSGEEVTLSIKSYSMSDATAQPAIHFAFYNASGTYMSEMGISLLEKTNHTFVVPIGTKKIRFIFRADQNKVAPEGAVFKITGLQIEIGSTATPFEPPVANSHTVTGTEEKIYLRTYEGVTNIFADYGVELTAKYGLTANGAHVFDGAYLEANGTGFAETAGNADKLDGYSGEDFLLSRLTRLYNTDANTLTNGMVYLHVGCTNVPADHVVITTRREENGNGTQRAQAVNNNNAWIRGLSGGTWTAWVKANDGGNAQTLDGLDSTAFRRKSEGSVVVISSTAPADTTALWVY